MVRQDWKEGVPGAIDLSDKTNWRNPTAYRTFVNTFYIGVNLKTDLGMQQSFSFIAQHS